MKNQETVETPYFHRSCPEQDSRSSNIHRERNPSHGLSKGHGLCGINILDNFARIRMSRLKRNTPLNLKRILPVILNSTQHKERS